LTVDGPEISALLHAVKYGIKRPRAEPITMTSQFANQSQPEYLLVSRVIEDVQPNKAEEDVSMLHYRKSISVFYTLFSGRKGRSAQKADPADTDRKVTCCKSLVAGCRNEVVSAEGIEPSTY
jgi:hypothetical protein